MMQDMHPPARRFFLSPVVLVGVFFIATLFAAVQAANFTVSPVLRDIPANTDIAVFEITNQHDQPLSLQVHAYAWQQRDGEDVRVPAEDLLIVPPVATVPPNKSQIVRVALRNPDRSREHAYRVVIRELPKQDETSRGFALQTLLAFDVPLFFAPDKGTHELNWRVARNGNGNFMIDADSTGSRYTRFDSIRLVGADGREIATLDGPLYVLAGAHRSWQVFGPDLPRGASARLVYSSFGQEHSVPLKIE